MCPIKIEDFTREEKVSLQVSMPPLQCNHRVLAPASIPSIPSLRFCHRLLNSRKMSAQTNQSRASYLNLVLDTTRLCFLCQKHQTQYLYNIQHAFQLLRRTLRCVLRTGSFSGPKSEIGHVPSQGPNHSSRQHPTYQVAADLERKWPPSNPPTKQGL